MRVRPYAIQIKQSPEKPDSACNYPRHFELYSTNQIPAFTSSFSKHAWHGSEKTYDLYYSALPGMTQNSGLYYIDWLTDNASFKTSDSYTSHFLIDFTHVFCPQSPAALLIIPHLMHKFQYMDFFVIDKLRVRPYRAVRGAASHCTLASHACPCRHGMSSETLSVCLSKLSILIRLSLCMLEQALACAFGLIAQKVRKPLQIRNPRTFY